MRWTRSLGGAIWRRRQSTSVPVQDSSLKYIPEPIARLVYDEYVRQYGKTQTFSGLHTRGGFSTAEVIAMLADIIERERSERSVQ